MEEDGEVLCDICSKDIIGESESLYRFRNVRNTHYCDVCEECREELGQNK